MHIKKNCKWLIPKVFEKRLENKSYSLIARELNKEGIKISSTHVGRILTDESNKYFIGSTLYDKSLKVNNKIELHQYKDIFNTFVTKGMINVTKEYNITEMRAKQILKDYYDMKLYKCEVDKHSKDFNRNLYILLKANNRAYNAIINYNKFKTIDEMARVIMYKDKETSKIYNLGKVSVNHILECLKGIGYNV